MAAPERPEAASSSSIPDYECVNVNSKAFHIGSFRDEWLKRLQPEDFSFQQLDQDAFDAKFAAEMGVREETMAELRAVCSADSLRCHPEDQEPDKEDRQTVGMVPETKADMLPEGEVIVTVNIYFPTNLGKFNGVRPRMTLLLTGSHTLADLRDAICCVSDLQVCGEFSSTPDMVPDFISKFLPSFMSLLLGSSTTIEWAKSHNYPSFSQAKMEDTRFVDLTVKLGFPYLYCHQGDCEHPVIITDVRLVHKSDCLDKRLYPLLTHKNRSLSQKCAVCHVFIGRWYTTQDQFAPSDPCLFCDKCFRMLHYDKDGKKLGEFLAYPYVDRGAFN
uniref:snRNA-activating protein complex subunit 3 n=1 Tax=Fundulus heteroclitus TaxID=8078 RepID=A0A3Q2SY33_FUNHE